MARWEKCRDTWDDSTTASWSMWLGVDLSNKIDISAAVKVWLAPNGDVYARSRFWIPEDGWKPAQNSRRNFTVNGIKRDIWNLLMGMLLTMP